LEGSPSKLALTRTPDPIRPTRREIFALLVLLVVLVLIVTGRCYA